MFRPKTERLQKLAQKFPSRIKELEGIFSAPTNVYIDYANVRPWSEKLGWHIEVRRLKQFLDSFDTIRSIKFYQGTLVGDADSEKFIGETEGVRIRRKDETGQDHDPSHQRVQHSREFTQHIEELPRL